MLTDLNKIICIIECIGIVFLVIIIIAGYYKAITKVLTINNPDSEVSKLLKHPKKCHNCKSNIVYYERFAGSNRGEYVCDDCGWAIDAVTGEVTFAGEQDE